MKPICPSCKKIQLKAHADSGTGLEIDVCPKCWGMWFDGDELSRFLKSDRLKKRFFLSEDVSSPQAIGFTISSKQRACPRCRQPMSEELYGDVSVDVCQKCRGIWLDDGELQRIVKSYYKGSHGSKVVDSELDKGFGSERKLSEIGSLIEAVIGFFGGKR